MYDIGLIQREMAKQFLSMRKLAAKAKISEPTISRIFKTGTGNPDTIGKLVRALKLNPDDVVLVREAVSPVAPPAIPASNGPVELPEPRTGQAKHELVNAAKEKRAAEPNAQRRV